jgi:superfamily II DNA or RNA helicase
VNRGQTNERWELKAHALPAFYRSLSHWCIFLTNPATYGWKDNCQTIPPIHIHIHDVDLTEEQKAAAFSETGSLFIDAVGGITKRSTLARICMGCYKGKKIDSGKPSYIRSLVDSWPEESTLIWCKYNDEQAELEKWFPEAASIEGKTPMEQREKMLDEFKSGRTRVMISKPEVLGFGLNLQVATRQVFSSCQDSYEEFYQAVKRSNRVGSTRPLNVHLPVTDADRPMMENVLRKAKRVQADGEEQERLFKEFGLNCGNGGI